MDVDFDPDVLADIRQYVEDLLDSGLRKRLIQLIKVFNLQLSVNSEKSLSYHPRALTAV